MYKNMSDAHNAESLVFHDYLYLFLFSDLIDRIHFLFF